MRVIDAHVHLYPPEAGREPTVWAEARAETHWATLCARRRKDGRPVQGFPSVTELLGAMDEAGVERAVLLGWYWEHHATCVAQNKFYADCVRAHPDRLAGFATLHPATGAAAVEEIHRARDAGLIGLGELSPHSQHFDCADPFWTQILDLAGELGLPVNLHVTDPVSRKFPGRVETPLEDFLRMARQHSKTKFILAHWGGGLAFDPAAQALSNVWFDTAATPLLYDPPMRETLLRKTREDRLIFGSDYPLILYPAVETRPTIGPLVDELKRSGGTENVLSANAAQLLRFGH